MGKWNKSILCGFDMLTDKPLPLIQGRHSNVKQMYKGKVGDCSKLHLSAFCHLGLVCNGMGL